MNDARDGRGPDDGGEAGAGREPAAETSGLDAGDWLAAQFDDDDDDDAGADADAGPDADEADRGGADADADETASASASGDVALDPDDAERTETVTAAAPISPETVGSPPFTVPPAPTAESEVVKSSGHPMALDLSALAGAVPPPSTEPTSPVAAAGDQQDGPEGEGEGEGEVEGEGAAEPELEVEPDAEPVGPPRYEVPLAVAPRPATAPPVAVPVEAEGLAADARKHEDEDPVAAAAEGDDDGVDPRHPDEPGPFTALISPPVAPEPVFPSSFDWSTPVAPAGEDESSAEDAAGDEGEASDEGATADEGATRGEGVVSDEGAAADAADDVEQAPVAAADDAQTRAFDLPSAAAEAGADVPAPIEAEPESDPEPGPDPEPEADPEVEPGREVEPEREVEAGREVEPEPESEPAAQATSTEPWWIAEHHEMTRRERREAEAAGVVVPPAVAPETSAAAAGGDDGAASDGAGTTAAPPAGPSFGAPAAPGPSAPRQEPTFTELLGIVRPASGSPESVEDTPGDPAADAGRSDLVDPGPLPAGGSWALSDDVAAGEPAAGAAEAPEVEAVAPDEELVQPVDLDDPFAVLQVEAEEDAPDAATAALPLTGAGLADAALPGAGEAEPVSERPRSVSHAEGELPGLTVGGGSAAVPTAASSAAPPPVPRGRASAATTPSAATRPSAATGLGSASTATATGSGDGIASWSRGRKVLLGVAAALVIVVALVVLFLLSRSLFAGTPQPTDAPAAAAAATRTVTAAPAEIAQEAPAGPLSTGTHPWNDLQGGECFSAFENAWQQDYDVVDCGQPHVAQLASIGVLDADPAAAYPGSDALQSQMSVLCTGADALDLAAASTYPDAQFSASWPSTDAEWAAGVRSYWCFVDRASGEAMTTSVAPAAA